MESESILLPPLVEKAALAAARASGLASSSVLAHLANTIAAPSADGHVIPYSTVAAIDPDGVLAHGLSTGEIMLNDWAADDLRSVNAQIEFVLREALRNARRRSS